MSAAPNEEHFGFSELLETRREAENYNRWIADQFEPYVGRRVLEVGCGIGNLAVHWVDREAFVGIDTEAACVQKCEARFGGRTSARFVQDRVGAPGWVQRWSDHRPDTVVAVNVLEHIADDVEALRGWRDIVRAGGGGHVCLFVPAFQFAYGSADKRYGHHRRYTKETLGARVREAGLELRMLRYFNMPGLLAWWTMFVLLKREDTSPGPIALYDRAVVPLARRIERRIDPPFGNSVVAVCRA